MTDKDNALDLGHNQRLKDIALVERAMDLGSKRKDHDWIVMWSWGDQCCGWMHPECLKTSCQEDIDESGPDGINVTGGMTTDVDEYIYYLINESYDFYPHVPWDYIEDQDIDEMCHVCGRTARDNIREYIEKGLPEA